MSRDRDPEFLLREANIYYDALQRARFVHPGWTRQASESVGNADLPLRHRVAALAILVYPARIKRIKL